MSIVTTSPRMRGKSKVGGRKSIVVTAFVIGAAVAWFLLRPSAPVPPVPPPFGEDPASSGPRDGATPSPQPAPRQPSPPSQEAQSAVSTSPTPSTLAPSTPSSLPAEATEQQPTAPRGPVAVSPIVPKPKIFDNPVENELEELSRAGGLGLRTPRVDMSHEETVEYLKRPVEIYEDDDPATVAAKERTAAMKTEALAYVEKGGTLNQFMRDYQAQARENEETLDEVRSEMKRILEAEGREAAQAYLDEVNPQLKDAGLPEVRLSGLLVKAVERRKLREAAEREATQK